MVEKQKKRTEKPKKSMHTVKNGKANKLREPFPGVTSTNVEF